MQGIFNGVIFGLDQKVRSRYWRYGKKLIAWMTRHKYEVFEEGSTRQFRRKKEVAARKWNPDSSSRDTSSMDSSVRFRDGELGEGMIMEIDTTSDTEDTKDENLTEENSIQPGIDMSVEERMDGVRYVWRRANVISDDAVEMKTPYVLMEEEDDGSESL